MHSTPTQRNDESRCSTTCAARLGAMGWLSMLLIVSGASAFSVDVSRISRVREIPSATILSASADVGSTKRIYRRRNHARTPAGVPKTRSRPNFHSSNIGWSSTQTYLQEQPEAGGVFSTRLRYRDGDDDQSSTLQQEHIDATVNVDGGPAVARWWKGLVSPKKKDGPIDEKQRNVDDYLEFLDRRYNRLHVDEKTETKKKAGFSALNWLKEHSPVSEQEAKKQEEDALYVLGVAELASEKLLQKHHITMRQASQDSQGELKRSLEIIDATVLESNTQKHGIVRPEIPPSALRSAMVLSEMVDAGATVLRRLNARRRVLIRYQRIKLRAATVLLAKTLSKTPKVAAALWKHGGGGKTLAFTASAAVAVVLFMRPIVQVMVYQAAYRG